MAADLELGSLGTLCLILLAVGAGGFARYFLGRRLLDSRLGERLPSPILCALLWGLTALPVAMAALPEKRGNELRDFALIVPLGCLLGLVFGGLCLLVWRRFTGTWPQRLLAGGLTGLVATLAAGVLLRNAMVIEANVVLRILIWAMMASWMVPVCAFLGLLTPRRTWRA